jgi:NitT/TauT family transport system substrate-binding protein
LFARGAKLGKREGAAVRRRRFLSGALATATLPARASASSTMPVRLGVAGRPCEGATFLAPESEVFRHGGIDVRIVRYSDERELAVALGAGTIDAATLDLPTLLGPLARGARIRVAAGLHSGCLRVVAPEDFGLRTFGNLKGSAIATDGLHRPSMDLLTALLVREDIDPRKDVSWHVYAPSSLEELAAALASNSIDCVAAADPLAYRLIASKSVVPYANTADGGFTCGTGLGGGHHCFLALGDRFVRAHPGLASALTHAYVVTSKALATTPGAAALAGVRGGFLDANLYEAIGILSSYDWSASTDLVLEELELTARDFRRAGLLAAHVDVGALAARAYVEL